MILRSSPSRPAQAGAPASLPEPRERGAPPADRPLPLPLERALRAVAVDEPSTGGAVAWTREVLPRLAGEALEPEHLAASSLTGDGFPVELSFTGDGQGGGELRWTTEIAGPAVPAARRLPRAWRRLAKEGVDVDREALGELAGWQALAPWAGADALAYGVWVGGRPAAPPGERLKLYGEIPAAAAPAAEAWLAERLGSEALLPGSAPPSPRMIGLQEEHRELYLRCNEALRLWRLPWLLRRAGLAHRWPDAAHALGILLGTSLPVDPAALPDRPLPGGSTGLSFSFDGADRPVAFTLYLFPRAVAPGDTLLRRRLLAAARPLGWDPEAYRQVSAPLERCHRRPGNPPPGAPPSLHHGLLALALTAEGPVRFAVGLRPPPPIPPLP